MQPAIEASHERLQLKCIDFYLMYTPYASRTGDDQDPRDHTRGVICDASVALMETWRAMEEFVDRGLCGAIGLSGVSFSQLSDVFDEARIKPSVVQIESHPYLPETEILEFCNQDFVLRGRNGLPPNNTGRLSTR